MTDMSDVMTAVSNLMFCEPFNYILCQCFGFPRNVWSTISLTNAVLVEIERLSCQGRDLPKMATAPSQEIRVNSLVKFPMHRLHSRNPGSR